MDTPSAHDDPGLTALMAERRRLIELAYRLLGSRAEAEDVVQETYVRWYALPEAKRDDIASPAAWLTTVAGRICLDLLRSARSRRERYVGAWIPEPLPGGAEAVNASPPGPGADPADRVTLDESVTMAFLMVLESMTPAQRVAFVLHDVFGYPFADVADIVGRTPAACRQLASTARRRVRASGTPTAPSAGQAGVVRDFKRAWEEKDLGALVAILDADATLTADGGGLASAARRPILGGERIARYAMELAGRNSGPATLLERTVNGRPGLLIRRGAAVAAVLAFEVAGDRIRRIWAVRNPEKLVAWE